MDCGGRARSLNKESLDKISCSCGKYQQMKRHKEENECGKQTNVLLLLQNATATNCCCYNLLLLLSVFTGDNWLMNEGHWFTAVCVGYRRVIMETSVNSLCTH